MWLFCLLTTLSMVGFRPRAPSLPSHPFITCSWVKGGADGSSNLGIVSAVRSCQACAFVEPAAGSGLGSLLRLEAKEGLPCWSWRLNISSCFSASNHWQLNLYVCVWRGRGVFLRIQQDRCAQRQITCPSLGINEVEDVLIGQGLGQRCTGFMGSNFRLFWVTFRLSYLGDKGVLTFHLTSL